MAVTKYLKQEKLRNMSIDELQARARELKATMFTHRFHKATGKLDNVRLLPQTKRRLAAVYTLIRQRELEAQRAKEAK